MRRKRKSNLNNRANSRKFHISPARDAAAYKWLKKSAVSVAADETQQKLHAAAEHYIGSLSDVGPGDARSIRQIIRHRLWPKLS